MDYSLIDSSPMDAVSPKSKVLMPTRGGSASSIVKGTDRRPTTITDYGPMLGDRDAGTKRFDLYDRSLNKGGKRKM